MQRAAYAHRSPRPDPYSIPRAIIPGCDRYALDNRNARARRNRRDRACARLRRSAIPSANADSRLRYACSAYVDAGPNLDTRPYMDSRPHANADLNANVDARSHLDACA